MPVRERKRFAQTPFLTAQRETKGKLKGGWGNPKILRPAKNRGEENFREGKTFGWLFPSLARWGGAAMVKFLWVGVVVKVKIFFACGALLLIVPHPIP